jgi:hypothetical protein
LKNKISVGGAIGATNSASNSLNMQNPSKLEPTYELKKASRDKDKKAIKLSL